MSALKLLALDTEDLAVFSAHLQDSVLKTGDMSFEPKTGLFLVAANRFVWESAVVKGAPLERRRSALTFKRVRGVRSIGIDRTNRDLVLALLAIRFEQAGAGPEGTIELVFSGGSAIQLDVECIEGQLADTGGAWETRTRPEHSLEG